MAVTKRTRFEVLRRDDHTCQYCGGKAPDVTLQIDHVMPVSLGGDDKPGNLVTACKDCNSGKSSITPDSPLVEGLSDRAAAYALGMQDKMTRFRADFEKISAFSAEFGRAWNQWTTATGEPVPLPPDYELSLLRWMRIGVPMRAIELAMRKAMSKRGLRGEHGCFTYMAGIVTRMLDEREIDLSVTEDAAAVCTRREVEEIRVSSFQAGLEEGRELGIRAAFLVGVVDDDLRNHIDGTTPEVREDVWGGSKQTGRLVRVGEGSRKNPD